MKELLESKRTLIAAAIILCLSAILSLPHYFQARNSAIPVHDKDGWIVSLPEMQNINPLMLEKAANYLKKTNATSFIIVRHGQIITEKYYRGQRPSDFCFSGSAANLLLSALIGLSIQSGEILDYDQKILSFFPEYAGRINDTRMTEITLRQLLNMTSGYGLFSDTHSRKMDWVGDQLSLKLQSNPGDGFIHAPEATYLISGVLTKVTGKSALELANERLFKQMLIPYAIWHTGPEKYNIGGNFLYMKALDLAKLGYLYINHGNWKGAQILTEQWVNETLHQGVLSNGDNPDPNGDYTGFGYGVAQRKTGGYDVYTPEGQDFEPCIYMIPDLDMVVVVTTYPSIFKKSCKYKDFKQIFEKFIVTGISQPPASIGRGVSNEAGAN